MAQSKTEFNHIPTVEFKISSTGITVLCERLYTPRFIPFEIKGLCESCKSDGVEIDFLVTIKGITVFCNRMRQAKFVPFDYPYLNTLEKCIFRVKTRAKRFNIEHGDQTETNILEEAMKEISNTEEIKETKDDPKI